MDNLAYLIFWLGAAFDAVTTVKALKTGRFREANPVARWVFDKLPTDTEMDVALFKIILFAGFSMMDPPALYWIILGVVQLGAGAWNYAQLKKAGIL